VQVRDLLGSPLLADPFHADRWDYVFTIERPGTQPQRRSVVARFEGDKLLNIEAPDLPSEREFVAQISRTSATGKVVALELTPEQRAALPVPPKQPATAPEPETGPVRTYPPRWSRIDDGAAAGSGRGRCLRSHGAHADRGGRARR
jgi:outer membrane protein assembly factor BamE